MVERVVVRQDFDSEAFECSFWRVKDASSARLESDVEKARVAGASIIDAKIPSGHIDEMRVLLGLGFRRVCMQVELSAPSSQYADHGVVEVSPALVLSDDDIKRHVANFTRDRFALDPNLPRRGHDRLFDAWIRNSLSGRREVVHFGDGFCTFAHRGDDLVIDLLSVLTPGRGIGATLVKGVAAEARRRGCRSTTVVTECENPAAVRTYRKVGFEIVGFDLALHWTSS